MKPDSSRVGKTLLNFTNVTGSWKFMKVCSPTHLYIVVVLYEKGRWALMFYLVLLLFLPGKQQSTSPCLQELGRTSNRTDINKFIPRCMEDGSYHDIQCRGLACYCTDSKGNQIKRTRTPRPLRPNCYGIIDQCLSFFLKMIFLRRLNAIIQIIAIVNKWHKMLTNRHIM